MYYLVIQPPEGRPFIRTVGYGEEPWPKHAARLELGEVVALEYFDGFREFFRVLAEHGSELAIRFADELNLRLAIRNPAFRDVVRDAEDDEELLREALTAAEEFPEWVCRQKPIPDSIDIILRDGRAIWRSKYAPRDHRDTDRLMVQIGRVLWDLLGETRGLQARVLELVEAGGGEPVHDLVEEHVRRLFAEDRLDEPLGMRVYSAYTHRGAEHWLAGEDDPVPPRFVAKRQRSQERIQELERRKGGGRAAAGKEGSA
jgi:hypothetical protein